MNITINFTEADILEMLERVQNIDEEEQEIVFEWISFEEKTKEIIATKITVGDDN